MSENEKINITDKYETVPDAQGRTWPVRIYAIDGAGAYPVHCGILTQHGWFNYSFTEFGRCAIATSEIVIQKINPYKNFKIDDKVLVWDGGSEAKFKGYFAGVSVNGKPMIFDLGCTSWTSDGNMPVEWDNCELYKEAECVIRTPG
jgi:hypothetical protein